MGNGDTELVTTNINLRAYQRRYFDAKESLNRSGVIRETLDRVVIPDHQIPPEHRPSTEVSGIFDLPKYQREAIREHDIDVREVLIEAINDEIPDEAIPQSGDGDRSESVGSDHQEAQLSGGHDD